MENLNTFGKILYIGLILIVIVTFLNSISFGFLFAFTLGLSGGMQVISMFACLFICSGTWALTEIMEETFKIN